MGMGEPLHNYDVTMAALDIMAEGLELSRNKIIVSTVGLADAMAEFLASRKAKLALSLHATTDEVRGTAHLPGPCSVLTHLPSRRSKGNSICMCR
jgi:adenine C2-methylase RlmN of 23S rRNA A2503 and tRNA A37